MASVAIAVRATPGASKNAAGGAWTGPDGAARLIVKVTAPPDSGRANKAIELLLASAFGLSKSAVSVTSGAKNRLKTVTLNGPDEASLKRRFEELLGERK
ncbi:DUF167 domain-containing protein [Hyphococcus luteus]|uniref:UPF0235 protein CW354_19575 n=1 Tax=Hyphococcus luteus TaxID=2058213 RepID=A0A2S7K212_9PROT|nr:DUF167 domain-containing protein [Marinicaulis flavus]PQA86526.1 hypothetical protein CW354_19575 [Marinicaulis flavus]